MMSLFEEIKFYILHGPGPGSSYHPCTGSHNNPESRKAYIRRASKSYTVEDDKLYYRHQGKLRLVLFTKAEVSTVLMECHDNLSTGGHPGLRRTTEKVTMSYHWENLREDVKKWVDECPRCQHHEKIKTLAPVLHPIHVKEPWSVLGVDLIGPLPTTSKGKRFILTATDLFTKWVVAKALYSKAAPEVSGKIADILMDFGLVQRIITDQGREFVNELNRGVFEALGVKHCITSAYHPQANGQDERTNKNIKEGLSKYCGEDQNDWDVHLRGIVAAINTSKQRSTKVTPYCALFGRHHRVPGIINATADDENPVCVTVEDVTEEHLETKAQDIADMHAKIYKNIQMAQQVQKKEYEKRKSKNVKSFSCKIGDEVLKANKRKEGRKGGRLEPNWTGPYIVDSITAKGVASLSSMAGALLKQKTNVSQLKPFIRPDFRESIESGIDIPPVKSFQVDLLHDHPYWSGADWFRAMQPRQQMLLNYVLDSSKRDEEVIVRDGSVFLQRCDFMTLGSPRWMESSIGNACLNLVSEAAQRHGIDVHIVDLYVVPLWKSQSVDPVAALPGDILSKDLIIVPAWSRQPEQADHYLLCVLKPAKREILLLDSLTPDGFGDSCYHDIFSDLAQRIAPGKWTTKFGADIEGFPRQQSGNSCGIFMLMYALSLSTDTPFWYCEGDIPHIRKWWCIRLMERFQIDGFGHRFAYWADEATAFLQGLVKPIYHLRRVRKRVHELARPMCMVPNIPGIPGPPGSGSNSPCPLVHSQAKCLKLSQQSPPGQSRDDTLEESSVMTVIKEACMWLDMNRHLFLGSVCRPAILDKGEEDALEALTAYNRFFDDHEGDEDEIREAFVFGFHNPTDMELFLSEVRDKRNVPVSAVLFE